MSSQGIYVIKCKLNNECYIGSSVNIESRWITHQNQLNKNQHHSWKLQKAWSKYKSNNFAFEIIELVKERNQLENREQFWIDYFDASGDKSGYNVSPNAYSNREIQRTEEFKRKLSKTVTGRKYSQKTKQLLSMLRKGEGNTTAKLTEKEAYDVINMLLKGIKTKVIAEKYKLSLTAIYDIHKKRRWSHISKDIRFPPLSNIGSSSGSAKLDEKKVKDIKNKLADGQSLRPLAKEYKISKSVILSIKKGETWKHVKVGRRMPEKNNRGENHTGAKLSKKDILKIRKLYKGGQTQTSLAKEFDVCIANISSIVLRKSWKHI